MKAAGRFVLQKALSKKIKQSKMLFLHPRVTKLSGQLKYFVSGKRREYRRAKSKRKLALQDISTPLENFEAESLAYWLGKFVQEVVNKEGKKYPARSLYSLITGIKRFLSDKNIVLNPLDKTDNR